MRTFLDVQGISPELFTRPVVTLGVFDGMHRGHRALLARARAMADGLDGDLVAITFNRHPRAITVGRAPPQITSFRHRLVLLEREGVDVTVVLLFDKALREMEAEDFVEKVIVGRIGAKGVVLGYDSHFGHNRRGDFDLVHGMLDPRGIPVEKTDPVTLSDGTVVSSSSIREAVARSDLAAAARLLGRPPALYGLVVRGDGRGKDLGFPTANLDLEGELRPIRGVYGAKVEIDGTAWPAAVNIGGRPTFYPEGDGAETVEFHVPGFSGDLYGRELELVLLGHIRDEMRFDSPEDLVAQIAQDLETLRARIDAGDWSLD